VSAAARALRNTTESEFATAYLRALTAAHNCNLAAIRLPLIPSTHAVFLVSFIREWTRLKAWSAQRLKASGTYSIYIWLNGIWFSFVVR
jgi:hypothetical protein